MIIINLSKNAFDARLKKAKLANEDGIAGFVKKEYFDEKLINIDTLVTFNKTKHTGSKWIKSRARQNKRLQIFDSNLFIGQTYFGNDGL